MNDLQLELTNLIGDKDLTFWCLCEDFNKNKFQIISHSGGSYWKINWIKGTVNEMRFNFQYEIIGHPATETDFKKWMNDNGIIWEQRDIDIKIFEQNILISYDSSKKLLDQDDETLIQIINFIKSSK